jgi:hypothetical protein
VIFFFVAAASFSGFQDVNGFAGDTGEYSAYSVSFLGLMRGTAQKPYIYRRLLPDVANWAGQVTPQPLQDRIYGWFYPTQGFDTNPKVLSFGRSPIARSRVWFFRYLVLYLCEFLSALAAVCAMYLVCTAAGFPPAVRVFAPVVVMLLLPHVLIFYYDYLELALIAVAVWMAMRFDWWWLLPVAAVGAWNKESFLFVIPSLYPLLRRRVSTRTACTAVLALCVVCGLVYLEARARFPNNPNSAVWLQWQEHVRALWSLRKQFYALQETYGLRLPAASTLLPTGFLLWTVARAWKHLSAEVRLHAKIAAAINFPLYLMFCWVGEYRNLSFLSVFFLLAVAWNLQDGLERAAPPSPRSA